MSALQTAVNGLDDPNDPHAPQRQPSEPSRSPSTTTGVIEREQVDTQFQEPGDHERFAHYVRKNKIMESALSGQPVVALCGKVWIPGRDPKRFPVCPTCKEIYAGMSGSEDGTS
ncbi:MAG TPA: DUF3039 domain-containing protein [Dermatophilaceae bacterium]|nr:DUF3039 domain-containing protein [Dermatophilaceae bacterium]